MILYSLFCLFLPRLSYEAGHHGGIDISGEGDVREGSKAVLRHAVALIVEEGCR